MSKRLVGRIMVGCKDKTSWHSVGLPDHWVFFINSIMSGRSPSLYCTFRCWFTLSACCPCNWWNYGDTNNKSAIGPSNINPARGHKDVPEVNGSPWWQHAITQTNRDPIIRDKILAMSNHPKTSEAYHSSNKSLCNVYYYYHVWWCTALSGLFLMFFWCPCMAINVNVRYNGGLLPDIILLTQCYPHRGTC